MRVIKRNGEYEDVSFDKTIKRIKSHSNNLNVDPILIAQQVCNRIFDGVSTAELDEFTSQICSGMMIDNPDYGILASRIIISNHHKNTSPSFSETVYILYNYKDIHGKHTPLVSKMVYDITMENKLKINSFINYDRDYNFDYFGFKTMEKSYLIKINGKIIERPQHMFMRVALGIHGYDIKDALETYDLMSQKYFIHATPTLFNAGTVKPQCSSCFLIAMEEDSIDGIYNTLKECAKISQHAGGIGLHIHNIRAKNSFIRGTNGYSNGLVPMLKVFNDTARYVDQCCDPDTLIYTKNEIKKIKNCIVGDEVIADDGLYYPLKKILNYEYNGYIYNININNEELKVTDKHPLWCIKNPNNYSECNIMDYLDNLILEEDFIEAELLNTNDYIGFSIPQYVKDYEEYNMNDCRFYGILLMTSYKNENDKLVIKLDKTSNVNTINFIEEYFSYYLLEKNKLELEDVVEYILPCKLKFTVDMVFDLNNNNKIINSFMNLPKNKLLEFLKGILELSNIKKDYFCIKVNSIKESLKYILLKLGILCNYDYNLGFLYIPKVSILCDLFYLQRNNDNLNYFEYKNKLFTKINSITRQSYNNTRVIDIEVDCQDHHNFLSVNGGLLKNGGGKRNGSIAIYLEPWHADIVDFLKLKKNTGSEEERARDLFYALWIPDLFMKKVEKKEEWCLFCPDECPGLSDTYGDEFEALYNKYELEGKMKKKIPALELWFLILDAQIESGTPYLCYKDSANRKSNQKNVGIIKSSNLCSEIIEYSSSEETAVCNLASISLPAYVEDGSFNFDKLHKVVKVITKNLNKIIDINFYPTRKTEVSNKRMRPLGLGVQGESDAFALLNYAFESSEAADLNKKIFETMYHAALECSMELSQKREVLMLQAREKGDYSEIISAPIPEEINRDEYLGSYCRFNGSPSSQGLLQFDLWNVEQGNDRYNWTELKDKIKKYGLRNSLFIAPMPTASTSQILGNNECFEPYTSNIYTRRTLAGEYVIINKHLLNDLQKIGLWNKDIKDQIILNNGSVQAIDSIPNEIKLKYKTVWEISQKTMIDLAADRAIYIDQSQSLNLFIESPNYKNLSSMHFYAFKKGLKTGIYYLRTKPKAKAQQFTIDPKMSEAKKKKDAEVEEAEVEFSGPACRRDNPNCEACGS